MCHVESKQGIVLTIINVTIMAMTIGVAAIPEDSDDDDDNCDSDEAAGEEDKRRLSFRPRDLSVSSQQSAEKLSDRATRASSSARWIAEHEDSDDETDSSDDEGDAVARNPIAPSTKKSTSVVSLVSKSSQPSLSATIRHTPRGSSKSIATKEDIEMTTISN